MPETAKNLAEKSEACRKIEEELHRKSISPALLMLAGLAVNTAAIILTVFLTENLGFYTIGQIGASAALFAYLGLYGYIKTDIGHKGVPLFFGTRLKNTLIDEGHGWLPPPPLMETQSVNVQERTMNIKEAEVIAGGKIADEEGGGENLVEMVVDTTLQWQVTDPYKVLSIGEEVIEKGLHDLVIDVLREKATTLNDKKFMRSKKALGTAINKFADELSDRWGIRTWNVFVLKVRPKSQKVLDSYEKRRIEMQERDAERIERDHFEESVAKLAKAWKIPVERALQAFQVERNKGSQRYVNVGGAPDSLVKAASIVADGMTDKTQGDN